MSRVVSRKVASFTVFLQMDFIPDQKHVASYKIDHSRYVDKSVTPALCTLDTNTLQNVSVRLSYFIYVKHENTNSDVISDKDTMHKHKQHYNITLQMCPEYNIENDTGCFPE